MERCRPPDPEFEYFGVPKYKIGDILVVSSPKGRIKPRECAILDRNEDELILSWGRKGQVSYFRAHLIEGSLYTRNGQELQIISTKERLGMGDAKLYAAYTDCLGYGLGGDCDVGDHTDLSDQERQWAAKAILLSRELTTDVERIQALKCLYSNQEHKLNSDLEAVLKQNPSEEVQDERQLRLW